jgi:hypothetical protein
MENNKNRIFWDNLSFNKNAVYLLEENQDKIDWNYLCKNTEVFNYEYGSYVLK